MATVRQKRADFRPVTVTLETQAELDAFVHLLDLLNEEGDITPASQEERLLVDLREEIADGIKSQP